MSTIGDGVELGFGDALTSFVLLLAALEDAGNISADLNRGRSRNKTTTIKHRRSIVAMLPSRRCGKNWLFDDLLWGWGDEGAEEMGSWGAGELGRWGAGELGRWGDGEMGRWGDGELGS